MRKKSTLFILVIVISIFLFTSCKKNDYIFVNFTRSTFLIVNHYDDNQETKIIINDVASFYNELETIKGSIKNIDIKEVYDFYIGDDKVIFSDKYCKYQGNVYEITYNEDELFKGEEINEDSIFSFAFKDTDIIIQINSDSKKYSLNSNSFIEEINKLHYCKITITCDEVLYNVYIGTDSIIIYNNYLFAYKNQMYVLLDSSFTFIDFLLTDPLTKQVFFLTNIIKESIVNEVKIKNNSDEKTYNLESEEKIETFLSNYRLLEVYVIDEIDDAILLEVMINSIVFSVYTNNIIKINDIYYQVITSTSFLFAYNEDNCDSFSEDSGSLPWI